MILSVKLLAAIFTLFLANDILTRITLFARSKFLYDGQPFHWIIRAITPLLVVGYMVLMVYSTITVHMQDRSMNLVLNNVGEMLLHVCLSMAGIIRLGIMVFNGKKPLVSNSKYPNLVANVCLLLAFVFYGYPMIYILLLFIIATVLGEIIYYSYTKKQRPALVIPLNRLAKGEKVNLVLDGRFRMDLMVGCIFVLAILMGNKWLPMDFYAIIENMI